MNDGGVKGKAGTGGRLGKGNEGALRNGGTGKP